MTDRTVTHTTFVIERTYPVTRPAVFAAFAEPELKERWFTMPPDWVDTEHALDFRIGGREINRGGPAGGPVHLFEARYQDIVDNERIVYAYGLYLDEQRVSVSLATIELAAVGGDTRMRFTEQGAFLDGLEDPAEREHGTNLMVDALGAALAAGLGAR
jgi:uncharacterized protein YndB with AHSA1/START domain